MLYPSITDDIYPFFPIVCFIGFLGTTIPLVWHLAAWNSGTCYYMFWSALICLNQFVNSIVWRGNALNSAPIWCDISARIIIGGSVGVPAASLCIHRRLHQIATVQSVTFTRAEKRRLILIDTLICILFPVIIMALQYVVQGHRFNIYEDVGCLPVIFNTAISYPLYHMWPLVIGLIAAGYCVLSLRAFLRRRADFNQFLSSNASVPAGRYFRLMAMASIEILLVVPLNIFSIYQNATALPLEPWVSWADTHWGFARVDQVPALFWRQNERFIVSMANTRWSAPVTAIIFILFFGFADEARNHYRMAFWAVLKLFGVLPAATRNSRSGGGTSIGGHNERKKFPGGVSLNSLPPYTPGPNAAAASRDPRRKRRPDSLSSSLAETIDDKEYDAPTSSFTSLHINEVKSDDAINVDLNDIPLTPLSMASHPVSPEWRPAAHFGSVDTSAPLAPARTSITVDGPFPPDVPVYSTDVPATSTHTRPTTPTLTTGYDGPVVR